MSSPTQLSSFDPAIHLHSAQDPPSDFQDDIDAAQQQREEIHAWNQANGIVIQHRAWRPQDVIWSELDHRAGIERKRRMVEPSANTD